MIISQFFSQNLDLVFFVYGLSFIVIGTAILVSPRKESGLKIAGILWLFAIYAFVHSSADFIDMRMASFGKEETLYIISQILTFISYAFLFEFGRRLMQLNRVLIPWWILPILEFLIFFFSFTFENFWATANVLTGYFVRFPAGIMSGFGFIWYYSRYHKEENLSPKTKKFFIIAGVSLFIWSFFCGIIRAEANFFPANWLNTETFFQVVGIPVYIFRTISGLILITALVSILQKVFKQKVQEYEESLERMILKRTGELVVSEEKYRNLIETIPICVKVVDEKGRIVFLNKFGREEHFIKEGADISRWSWLETIDNRFREEAQKLYEAALRGKRGMLEFAHTPEGSRHGWCLSIFSPVKDETGQIKFVMIYSGDVTDKAQAEKRVKELNILRNQFIQLMSHQLRTPLNSMRWSMETLLAGDIGKLKDEQKNFLKIPYEASVEILKRLDDILSVLDIEEGRIVFKKEEIPLDSILKSVMSEFKNKIDLKEINFQYFDSKAELPPVNCDGEKIRKVFEQLFDNAVTYTPNKGKIAAKLYKTDSLIRFEISDTGIGIPKAEQARIFSRFFRATNAYTMKADASGIGLSLAKYFIEQHGGKMGFESEEDKGSAFWFEIPIK